MRIYCVFEKELLFVRILKNRRFISLVLAVVMVVSVVSAGLLSSRANSYTDPSIVLLESMLNGDRKWVIDTIVEDNRSNNPYAGTYSSTKTSLMATALSQLENPDDPNYRKTYTAMVNLLTTFYYEFTWDDDLMAGVLDLVDEILELFGDGENALGSFLDDLKKTTEEQKFEAILQGVFTDTYTASWGESVNEQEASLKQLSEIAATLENLEALASYWSDLYGITDVEDCEDIFDYHKEVVDPLITSGKKYLGAFSKMSDGEQAATSVAISAASALALWNWSASHSTTYSGVPTLTQDLLDFVAGKEAMELVKTAGDTFSFASGAINQFSYLNAMCQQSNTFHDTLIRMADQADRNGQYRMGGVLRDYAEDMDVVLDTNALNYHIFVNQLGKTSTVKKNLKISKAFEKGMPKEWKDAYKNSDLKTMTKVFSVGMFGVDLATGLKNTCIKLSELKYLRTMITEAKNVYYQDMRRYTAEPTPDNAQKVLNDLLFLQRLRLRGENIAFKMAKGQLNSGIAKLISGYSWQDFINQEDTTEAKAWQDHYQRSIDCLIGATINPFSYSPFEVSAGQRLVIYYDEGTNTYRGGYSDGTVLYEMQYRIMSGIQLNGGTLSITDLSVPFIHVTNGGTLSIDASTARVGELTQSGQMTLNVYQDDLEFETCLDLSNATVNLNGFTISSPDITLSSSVSFQDGTVETEALHLNTATVVGENIRCSGDVDATGSCTLGNLTMVGRNEQNINGSMNVGSLVLDNRTHRIQSTGTITVTGSLYDPKDIVSNGIVLTNTAGISGDTVASDLTLKGTTISGPVQYKRSVRVMDGASVRGGSVRGTLTVSSGCLTNSGSTLNVENGILSIGGKIQTNASVVGHGDSYFSNTVFSGSGGLDLYGEVSFASGNSASAESVINLYGNCTTGGSKDSNRLATLRLCGASGQTIGYTGTVANLELANRSAFGVKMTGSTYVTDRLTAKDQRISLGNNIILTGEATAELDNVSGSLQIENWSGTGFSGLNGTLYASGNNTITSDMVLGGGIRQTSGSITLQGATVECREMVESSGSWVLDPDSALIMKADSALTGSVQNQGRIVAENLVLSAGVSGNGTIQINGDLTNNQSNAITNLMISGDSAQHISGSQLTVGNLVLANTGRQGTTFDTTVYVTDSITARDQKVYSGERLTLTGAATADLENVSGNLRIENWTGDSLPKWMGTLYASGNNTISSDITLRGGIRQTGGTITVTAGTVTCQEGLECAGNWNIGENAALVTPGDGVIQGNVVNNGLMQLSGLTLGGTLSGDGTLDLRGNLQCSNANTFGTLMLSGDDPQEVSGSNLTLTNLIIDNTSARGVTFHSQVYVKENYVKNATVYGTQPLQLLDSTLFDGDATIASLSPSGSVRICENVTLIVRGDVTTSKSVVLEKGAKLIVYGRFQGSSTIEIGEGAQIDIHRDLLLNSAAVVNDGTLLVRQDASLSGGSISGAGTLEMKGDLQNSGTISGLHLLTISGRAPQTLTGNDIHVACLSVDNRTYSGVKLGLNLYCSDEITITDGSVITEDRIKEE